MSKITFVFRVLLKLSTQVKSYIDSLVDKMIIIIEGVYQTQRIYCDILTHKVLFVDKLFNV